MPEIVLNNVTKKWGKFIGVNNLSMTIADHAFVTLLGPSGCGKTTTLRMIAGLETPTSGRITIGGKVVFDSDSGVNVSPGKRDIGFLFQNYALWPHMTVRQNVAFGLENLKWKKENIDARISELLKMMDIEQFEGRYPNELSGGQQQRVAIARTLAPRPTVLLMDEPLSNLDAKLRLEMRSELKRLHQSNNSTFVYVTHDQLEAMTLATQVCLIREGNLQQYEPPLDIYREPINLFVADFVGNPSMNFIQCDAKQVSKRKIELSFHGVKAEFEASEDVTLIDTKPSEPEAVPAPMATVMAEPKKKGIFQRKKKEEKVFVKTKGNSILDRINKPFVLGIRPEFIKLVKEGGIPVKVYSSLPSGMETTVKFILGDTPITSVVFGIIDYKVDTPIEVAFEGDGILLYDGKSTKKIGNGTLRIISVDKK
ncbi:MAG: ABC transporter ATP-binding protein [Bacilli bacterium]|jgi:multiple sugar transport system ATP-binding protein|nr:ABC transporter ATP-binding protein [Bacilli bacterium]